MNAFVIGLDATVVAPVFEKSYAMFASILGRWLPFPSIFAATYLMGLWVTGRSRRMRTRRAGAHGLLRDRS